MMLKQILTLSHVRYVTIPRFKMSTTIRMEVQSFDKHNHI